MREILEKMKDITIFEPVVTIKSILTPETKEELNKLADSILN